MGVFSESTDHDYGVTSSIAIEETSIVWTLLREPPFMPSRHAPYLDLVATGLKSLEADPTGRRWLVFALGIAAGSVRSAALMTRLIQRLTHAAQATLTSLPPACSQDVYTPVHAAVRAVNLEAIRALMASGYPLKPTLEQIHCGARDDAQPCGAMHATANGQGALELACHMLVERLQTQDGAAEQLVEIAKILAEHQAGAPTDQYSASMRVALEGLVAMAAPAGRAQDGAQFQSEPIGVADYTGDVKHLADQDHGQASANLSARDILQQLVGCLLRNGADPGIRIGNLSKTPLHIAIELKDWRSAAALIAHGADIDEADANGASAMTRAKGSLGTSHTLRAILRFAEIDKSFFR